jgi:hypothetical protein
MAAVYKDTKIISTTVAALTSHRQIFASGSLGIPGIDNRKLPRAKRNLENRLGIRSFVSLTGAPELWPATVA